MQTKQEWTAETITPTDGIRWVNAFMRSSQDDALVRVNMIAAYCNRQLMAPFTIEGACNRTVFETWIETCLIGSLKPGQWLVIDNATFHKGGRIEQLIEQAECKVIYLPPYSPDLNKIEKCWSWLKSRIRQCLSEFDCLRDAMEHILKQSS